MANWTLPFPDKQSTGYFGKVRTFKGAPKNPHRGTDWALRNGTLIPFITDGKIMLIQFSRILGWVVVQSAKDSKGNIWFIGYCHLKEKPKKLKVGDRVKCGDKVIKGGNTGSASSGAHLHATLSNSVKGVFFGSVFDLHKKIKEELKHNKTSASVVKPKTGEIKVEAPATIKSANRPDIRVEAPATIKVVEPPKAEASGKSLIPVHGSLDSNTWKAWQSALGVHGYSGPVDGEPGIQSWSAVQLSGRAFGYSGPIDGKPGGNTFRSIQRRLTANGFYDGRTDGDMGVQTIKALQKALNAGKY
jgi:murein DD-endopeptidase MepM/ murein hydrolase activator NlpD